MALLLLAVYLGALGAMEPEGLKAPVWIAYLASGVCALAGAASLARASGRPLLADGLACMVLGGMWVMSLWVAFGPGARECSGRTHTLGPAMDVSEAACRTAFGLGALIVGAMLVFAVRGWLRRRSVA